MKKIVLNNCVGGFSLSLEGIKKYFELTQEKCYFYRFVKEGGFKGHYERIDNEEMIDVENLHISKFPTIDIDTMPLDAYFIDENKLSRTDPILIQVVEELGDKANGKYSSLIVREIPDGLNFNIEDDGNGREFIALL